MMGISSHKMGLLAPCFAPKNKQLIMSLERHEVAFYSMARFSLRENGKGLWKHQYMLHPMMETCRIVQNKTPLPAE